MERKSNINIIDLFFIYDLFCIITELITVQTVHIYVVIWYTAVVICEFYGENQGLEFQTGNCTLESGKHMLVLNVAVRFVSRSKVYARVDLYIFNTNCTFLKKDPFAQT